MISEDNVMCGWVDRLRRCTFSVCRQYHIVQDAREKQYRRHKIPSHLKTCSSHPLSIRRSGFLALGLQYLDHRPYALWLPVDFEMELSNVTGIPGLSSDNHMWVTHFPQSYKPAHWQISACVLICLLVALPPWRSLTSTMEEHGGSL